jgi:hypothetical protein
MQCRLPRAQLRHTYASQFIPVKRYCLFFIILYSDRQKYGINSLKIKQFFFNLWTYQFWFIKNTYCNTK